jgi:hypothetical protein
MFPVNLAFPKYKETWIVDYADKVCAHYEIVHGRPKINLDKETKDLDELMKNRPAKAAA